MTLHSGISWRVPLLISICLHESFNQFHCEIAHVPSVIREDIYFYAVSI